jgi:hypothetical protein
MNITEIVQQLKDERGKLDAAIQSLEGVSNGASAPGARRGRPPGSTNKPVGDGPRKRRTMSAAARKAIGDATRRRWAAWKKAQKK